MKRIILATLCVIFSVGLFAQKALIIYKKDGTKMEIPLKGIESFEFVGKGLVHDGEYISLSNMQLHSGVNLDATFTVNFHSDNPNIMSETPDYGYNWGILYSTTPNVTVESGELIQLDNSQTKTLSNLVNDSVNALIGNSSRLSGLTNRNPINLEYETTYYIRAFVKSEVSNNVVKHFYSNEISVNTGKPAMIYYGVTADPAQYAETGYVMPTGSAWASFIERFSYFNRYSESILDAWNNYLTPERIASIKSQCNTVYECREGMLYILDNIGDDFYKYALDFYDDAFAMDGYTEDTKLLSCDATSPTHVTCDATWNIPNNEYWEYKGLATTSNQSVEIPFSQPLMANFYYNVEITFAPDVSEAETLPTKYDVSIYGSNEKGNSRKIMTVKNQVTNVGAVTVATLDSIQVPYFGEASVEIKQTASRNDKIYSRILRISQIKVTPVGPINKDEE